MKAFEDAAALVADSQDIIHGRVEHHHPPAWLVDRGWLEFTIGWTDEALHAAERSDIAAWLAAERSAPPSLRELAARVVEVTRVPPLLASVPEVRALHGANARKRVQVGAFTRAAAPLAERATRILDVGSGHGHLTRELSEAFGRPALGIEHHPQRVHTAVRLTHHAGVEFLELDVVQEGLPVRAGDLLVGLHACGALGESLLKHAADHQLAVALVACCPQKIPTVERTPLTAAPGWLTLERNVLGLANVTARAQGVEASLDEELRARERRLALRLLLEQRGVTVRAGAEMQGINRRRAHGAFGPLAAEFLARRGLPPASMTELADVVQRAAALGARMRRWDLPRAMLGRALEVYLMWDRAMLLHQRGMRVRVGTVFPSTVSPRNLMILGEC